MKKNNLMPFIGLMFLLGLSLVFAGFPFTNDNGFVHAGNETCTGATPLANWSTSATCQAGWLSIDNNPATYVHRLINSSTNTYTWGIEMTICLKKMDATNRFIISLMRGNTTTYPNGRVIEVKNTGSGATTTICQTDTGICNNINGWKDDATCQQLRLTMNNSDMGDNVGVYINGSYVTNQTASFPPQNPQIVFFGFGLDNTNTAWFNVTNISIYNGSFYNLSASAPDTTFPIVNVSMNNTSPRRYDILNITANITDETGLSTANITINFSTGKIFLNYTISGTSAQISNATNITDARGNVLNITVYTTDTSNNVKQNSTLIIVADTPQNTPTIIQPIVNTLYNIQPLGFNITWALDADGENPTNVYFWINNTAVTNQSISLTGGNTGNTTFNASDGKYNLSVSICDDFSCSPNATISSFKIDTVNPLISNMPSNTSPYSINTNWTSTADDVNLEGFNCTAYNGLTLTSGVKFSTELTDIASSSQDIKIEMNTSWGDGSYLIICEASDDHNSPDIQETIRRLRNLEYEHPIDSEYVRLVFKKGDKNISMWVGYYANGVVQRLTKVQAQLYNVSRLTYIGEEGYEFGALFKLPSANFTFGFAVEKSSQLKLRSNGTAHFKWTRDYYADFDAEINGTQIAPNIKEVADFYGIYYTPNWTALGFSANDIINFTTKTIGGVNKNQSNSTIEIDTGLPQFFSLNVSRDGLRLNNTFFNNGTLNFTYNVSDKNNESVLFYVAGSKNISVGYISNVSGNATITFADGNYTILLEINDSAGNKFNSSYINIVVDTTKPNVTQILNRTTGNSTTITTETDVNITFLRREMYFANTSINTNYTGVWANYTPECPLGNGTCHFVILKGNFTAGQIVGHQEFVNDSAGNLFGDSPPPVYTFNVQSVSQPSATGAASGSTSSISIPQSLLNPFGTEPINEKCAEKEQLLDGRCYPCDPEIGYLEFNPSDRSVMCRKCEEGFKLENKQCILKSPISPKDKLNAFIDNLAEKISQYLNMSILIGYIAVFFGFVTIIYYGYLWLKR